MTEREEELADITLAILLGIKWKARGDRFPGAIWIWEHSSDFGATSSEVEASREFLNAYRSHHRTIQP